MSVNVILSLNVKPGCLDDFVTLINGMLPTTRKYDGCVEVNMYQNQENKNQISLLEEWESKQHYESYFAWRTETGDVEKIMALAEGPPSITYLDKVSE